MFRLHENEILVPERRAEKFTFCLSSTNLSELFEDFAIQTFAPQCRIQVFPFFCGSAREHPAT